MKRCSSLQPERKRNLLTAGNSTMPTTVGIFNLPAPLTCTPSSWCKEHCYACKNRYGWECVQNAHMWRWSKTIEETFADQMIAEIKRRERLQWIRIHISGDFFDVEYVQAWADIAAAFPYNIFRTNTRRQDLLPEMVRIFPSNVVVRESIDPTREPTGLVPVHAIVGTPGSDDYFVCNNDCDVCKFHCWTQPEVNVRTSAVL